MCAERSLESTPSSVEALNSIGEGRPFNFLVLNLQDPEALTSPPQLLYRLLKQPSRPFTPSVFGKYFALEPWVEGGETNPLLAAVFSRHLRNPESFFQREEQVTTPPSRLEGNSIRYFLHFPLYCSYLNHLSCSVGVRTAIRALFCTDTTITKEG